jgi:hypothetical protein
MQAEGEKNEEGIYRTRQDKGTARQQQKHDGGGEERRCGGKEEWGERESCSKGPGSGTSGSHLSAAVRARSLETVRDQLVVSNQNDSGPTCTASSSLPLQASRPAPPTVASPSPPRPSPRIVTSHPFSALAATVEPDSPGPVPCSSSCLAAPLPSPSLLPSTASPTPLFPPLQSRTAASNSPSRPTAMTARQPSFALRVPHHCRCLLPEEPVAATASQEEEIEATAAIDTSATTPACTDQPSAGHRPSSPSPPSFPIPERALPTLPPSSHTLQPPARPDGPQPTASNPSSVGCSERPHLMPLLSTSSPLSAVVSDVHLHGLPCLLQQGRPAAPL